MKKLYQYTVTFYTTKGGFQCWKASAEGSNAKEAREKFKLFWETNENLGHMHTFRIELHRLKPGEQFLFNKYKRISVDEWQRS